MGSSADPSYISEHRPKEYFRPLLRDRRTTRLVCIEEHTMAPFPVPSTSVTWKQFMPEYLAGVKHRLGDVGLRISTMDANHIGAQIVSMNQPGAQGFTEVDDCIQFCRQVNQFVYDEYIKKHPRRFFAFATLPTQEGKAAAAELERCINEYEGFVGAMINGYTNTKDPETGLYLDDPQFDVLWEVAQRLDKPIFIHPRPPLVSNIRTLADQPVFHGAPYGFGRETVEHCLRLMYAGVFDRFPGLKIALGHMGEGLSWILPRTDSTFRLYTKDVQGPKKREFLDYFQDNFIVNTSGMPRTSALLQLLAETRRDHVMFSVDYPYESISEMRSWFETVPLAEETWRDIGYRNAIRLFKLPLNYDGDDGEDGAS